MFDSTPTPRHVAGWLAMGWLLGACATVPPAVHEAVATAPLVGADAVDLHGVGTAEEVLQAGSYTYVRVSDLSEGWLVFAHRAPALGETVRWRGYAERRPFHSRRLDRDFERVVFASTDAEEEG